MDVSRTKKKKRDKKKLSNGNESQKKWQETACLIVVIKAKTCNVKRWLHLSQYLIFPVVCFVLGPVVTLYLRLFFFFLGNYRF